MSALARDLDEIAAETGFSGVVRLDRAGELEVVRAYGLADRAHAIPNTPDTQFGDRVGHEGTDGARRHALVEDGALRLETTARSVLGSELPLIDEARHDRAPAGAPLGDRGLPRRGARPRLLGLSAARARAPAGHDRGLSRRSWTGTRRSSRPASASAYATAARPARAHRGTRGRDAVPRPRPRPRLRAGGDGATRPFSARRASRSRGGRVRPGRGRNGGRTSSTYPCAAAGTAASTRPPRTSRRSARRCSRRDRAGGDARGDGQGAKRSGRDRGYGLGFWLPAGGRAVRLHGGDTGVRLRHRPRPGATRNVDAAREYRRSPGRSARGSRKSGRRLGRELRDQAARRVDLGRVRGARRGEQRRLRRLLVHRVPGEDRRTGAEPEPAAQARASPRGHCARRPRLQRRRLRRLVPSSAPRGSCRESRAARSTRRA